MLGINLDIFDLFKTDGKNYYMTDVIFKKKAMTDLYEEIIAKIEEHHITWLVIENNTDTSLKALLDKMLEDIFLINSYSMALVYLAFLFLVLFLLQIMLHCLVRHHFYLDNQNYM